MKVILIGYMGSGKSLVGRRLSEVLSLPYIDLDYQIEKEVGLTISEIFKQKGEIFFRRKEQQTLEKLLQSELSYILATGGGTPCYGNVMQQIKDTVDVKSIFLNTTIDTLTDRLFPERQQRPLISHLKTKEALNDFIRKHIFERNFYYLQSETKVDANETLAKVTSQIVLSLF